MFVPERWGEREKKRRVRQGSREGGKKVFFLSAPFSFPRLRPQFPSPRPLRSSSNTRFGAPTGGPSVLFCFFLLSKKLDDDGESARYRVRKKRVFFRPPPHFRRFKNGFFLDVFFLLLFFRPFFFLILVPVRQVVIASAVGVAVAVVVSVLGGHAAVAY